LKSTIENEGPNFGDFLNLRLITGGPWGSSRQASKGGSKMMFGWLCSQYHVEQVQGCQIVDRLVGNQKFHIVEQEWATWGGISMHY
jgi:hypothetical protein